MAGCYAVFHMNLAFSAISEARRAQVIHACYYPLLELAARGFRLGIECNAWSLEEIERIEPSWIARFRELLSQGRCELIGSGYIQLIGPLVPSLVNRHNQALGLKSYERLLGIRPRLLLVNEMAYSESILQHALEHGFEGLIMERENVRMVRDGPVPAAVRAKAREGTSLPVLWGDTILFQKLQRYVHRDIGKDEYLDLVNRRLAKAQEPMCLYCSDTEIFGFRPRRYTYETHQAPPDEWERLEEIIGEITGGTLELPSEVLDRLHHDTEPPAMVLGAVNYPIPVKKQLKYNVSRWAVSGRDDLALNTLCHRIAGELEEKDHNDASDWRKLCRLWSSDLRTHIHEARFKEAESELRTLAKKLGIPSNLNEHPPKGEPIEDLAAEGIEIRRSGLFLEMRTAAFACVFNLRRGLTIQRLGFADHGFTPLIGTLPHGYFEKIALGADFYSAGIVVELPGEMKRITDLEQVRPRYFHHEDSFEIQVECPTPLGPMVKSYHFSPDRQTLDIHYAFPGWTRPNGTLRLGMMTLLPEGFSGPLAITTHQGGDDPEHFQLDRPCAHDAAVSSLITCTTGFGATTGNILIGDRKRGLDFSWDPGACAAFPMLRHEPSPPSHFTRVYFSLSELDDTRKPGGTLPDFRLKIRPWIKKKMLTRSDQRAEDSPLIEE
jgi:hypothetical protein